jgi:PAS domain S-box-containing protein
MTASHGDEGSHSELYQRIIEQSADVATIVDDDGTITYVSPSVRHVLGYDPDDLVGNQGYEYVHPDDREANANAVEKAMNGAELAVAEVRFRRADGTWCWIEATLRDHRADPVIGGILAMSREISDRKRKEQEYRRLAKEYETFLENVEDAIFFLNVYATDTDHEFKFEFDRLSPSYEEQTGMSTQQVKGKTPKEVFGDERGAELTANYHRCVRAREPLAYQEDLPVTDDARFWDTVLAPVISDDEVTRLIGITRNVTERVRKERQLRSKNEQLDEFASVVSHDLRNPLTVALGRIEFLAKEDDDEHIAATARALDRMDEIIEDTLTLARQGKVVSDMEEIDFSGLIGRCWHSVPTGEATLDLADEFRIRGDQSRLQHLFENLFRNAIEHGGADVTVRVGRFDTYGIYVEDTGQGIPEEQRESVLEPGHSSTNDGTGFGLAIVKRIAEAHGWVLQITAGSEGGARFEFQDVDIIQQ